MAVARMLKVVVLAHQAVMDDLVGAMQHAGVVDLESSPADMPSAELAADDRRVRRLEEHLADVSFVRDFLGRHHTSDQPFGAFVSEKTHLSEAEYHALSADAGVLQLYRECEEISSRIATHERERERLLVLADELSPWEPLRTQFARLRDTDTVEVFTGTVPAVQGPAIREALREVATDVSVEELSSVGGRAAWVVMAHRDAVKAVRDALALTDFQDAAFPGLMDYPAEERARALGRAGEISDETEALDRLARELATNNYHRSVALAEAVASQLDALTVRERFGTTERTFMVTGWVRERQRHALEEALERFQGDADLSLTEPEEQDLPPVVLENPWFIRPFETLTGLYGLPRYDELDPTPLLAPFFLVFFSICISDVGYGAMLIAGAWYIKNKIDVAPGVKLFMDLLMFGGAGAMVAGVLFGSYFALDFAMLSSALPFLPDPVLDPLNELPTFLIGTVLLGMVQVFFGVLVAAYDLARRGDRASAFFDQFSTILMFAALGVGAAVPAALLPAVVLGIGVTVLFKGRALEAALKADGAPAWDRAMGMVWIALLVAALLAWGFSLALPAGWALLALTAVGLGVSRSVRRAVVAMLGGLYAVYSMTAFIGDILSYTRLAALGLSGALVGMVFNRLAGLAMGGASGLFEQGGAGLIGGAIVVVLASLVFVVGHVFNVVINLLGAFVHPARLQFVEFFSKFYVGGGRAFTPFAHRTKSLVLHAGEVRQEGA
ncbi:MAG: V-type ATP synthase subunit I [Coriobacteriia bacterium]